MNRSCSARWGQKRNAIWSLFLASGYLKVENYELDPDKGRPEYELALTNKEVRLMFEDMIEDWLREMPFHTMNFSGR